MSGGRPEREGGGDEYLALVKCVGGREILMGVIGTPFDGIEPPE